MRSVYGERYGEADEHRLVLSPARIGDGGADHGHQEACTSPGTDGRRVGSTVSMENVLEVHDQVQVDTVESCDFEEDHA